jgi:hypothetical protein
MRDVYGAQVYVHNKNFPLFRTLEDDLRFMRVGPRQYAYGVANALKTWVRNKKMSHVPMKVFCGDWAMTRYLKVSGYMYVDVSKIHEDDSDAIVFHDELLFARYYVDALVVGHNISITNAVDEMQSYMSEQWIDAYKDDDRPVKRVTEALCTEYRVKASSYEGIAEQLRVRDISVQ